VAGIEEIRERPDDLFAGQWLLQRNEVLNPEQK
jgi:hypothetical protein